MPNNQNGFSNLSVEKNIPLLVDQMDADGLFQEDVDPTNFDGLAVLRKQIKRTVLYWLDYDLEMLYNVLYRLDVGEQKVRNCLDHAQPTELADDLTELILEREQQKLYTRLKYKEEVDKDDPEAW